MRPLSTDSRPIHNTELDKKYNVLLLRLNDGLTKSNLRDLRYLCGISAGQAEKIDSGIKLFEVFQNEGDLGKTNISVLYELFEAISRRDLLRKLDEYNEELRKVTERRQYEDGCKVLHTTMHQAEPISPQKNNSKPSATQPTEQLPNKTCGSTVVLIPPSYFSQSSRKVPFESIDPSESNSSQESIYPEDVSSSGSLASIDDDYDELSNRFSNVAMPTTTHIADTNSVDDKTSAFAFPTTTEIECYKMSCKPRGLCLIISNRHFSLARENGYCLQDRPGTRKDEENLMTTFQSLLFDVRLYTDLTAMELWKTVDMYARENHSNYDSFVCCILSHGCLGGIFGIDGKSLKIYNILSVFSGLASPTLSSKPKVFFFQACRGIEPDSGYARDDCHNDSIDDMMCGEMMRFGDRKSPTESDYFIGYATPPGYTAWIHKEDGSWYVNALCRALVNYSKKYDLNQICTKVNDIVSKLYTAEGFKQIPNPTHTLTKLLYFFPEESNYSLTRETKPRTNYSWKVS